MGATAAVLSRPSMANGAFWTSPDARHCARGEMASGKCCRLGLYMGPLHPTASNPKWAAANATRRVRCLKLLPFLTCRTVGSEIITHCCPPGASRATCVMG